MQVKLDIAITEIQDYVFFTCKKPMGIYPKGGRAGVTHGAAICLPVIACQNPNTRILWGDVSNGNVNRYIEQFMLPVLNKLPKQFWRWNKGINRITIGSSFIDFRFAANPQNWEGQGYEYIFINEAGIVLKDSYIYDQVILKSMLDSKIKPRCILSGVPKGSQTFFATLIERAKQRAAFKSDDIDDHSGSDDTLEDDWDYRTITTYDNPLISKARIDKLVEDEPEIARQEVFGEVIGSEEHPFQVFPNAWVKASMEANDQVKASMRMLPVTNAAIDPSLGGDECVFATRRGRFCDPVRALTGVVVNSADKVSDQFRSFMEVSAGANFTLVPVAIDIPGIGEGVHSHVKRYMKTAIQMKPSTSVSYVTKDKTWVIKDAKTMWAWALRELLDPTRPDRVLLPNDPVLAAQLGSFRYEVKVGNVIKLITKDEQKALLGGKSPDRADCIIYLNAPPPQAPTIYTASF